MIITFRVNALFSHLRFHLNINPSCFILVILLFVFQFAYCITFHVVSVK